MGLFDQFPYTNFHELNLDWILKALRELEHTIDQFVAINALKYADPIQWNITSQYEKNTIVIDPQSGTAYISVQPVPVGVALTNPDYWTVVFDLEQFVTKANGNFTLRVEPLTTLTATFATPIHNWVIWGGDLYRAITNITAGDQYVVDGNIKRITVEEITGDTENLLTVDKSNLVSAINELITGINTLFNNIGDLNDLTTSDKTSIVNAINELVSSVTTLAASVGDISDLTTTDKSSVVNAINELVSSVTTLNTSVGTLNTSVGDLNNLTTSDKSNLVNAINEINNVSAYDWKNVKDLGAVGDGTTHALSEYYDSLAAAQVVYPFVNALTESVDYAAIQKAVNEYNAVYIPEGTYMIDSPITLPLRTTTKPNLAIRGASQRQTILTPNNPISNIFSFTREDEEGEIHLELRDLGFKATGNTTNGLYFYGRMSAINPSRRLDANSLLFENIYGFGMGSLLSCGYCNHCHCNNVYADSCGVVFSLTRAASFMYFFQCYSVLCVRMITAYDATQDGISNGVLMTNCVSIFNSDTGYHFTGYQAVYLCECTCDLSSYAGAQIVLTNCTDFDINGGWISGFNVTGSYGIILINAFYGYIRGMTIANVDYGILVRNGNSTMSSLVVRDNRFAINKNVAVYVESCIGLSICNCLFDETLANTIVYSAGTDYNILTENMFKNADFSPASGTHSVITNNIFSCPTT